MKYEVEQKFRVRDLDEITSALHKLGAAVGDTVEQSDLYFAHPARDFAKTDEAFRLRRVGVSNFVTYKGPKIDSTTKTRREIELPLPGGDEYAVRFMEMLLALGFGKVEETRKHRRKAWVDWQGSSVEVSLDDVYGLGCFVELELTAEESEVDKARQQVVSLAQHLGLSQSERRSYLELLLELPK